jgi:hypothetical protein
MSITRLFFVSAFVFVLAAQDRVPGTEPLTIGGDLAARMVDGINTYLIRETDTVVGKGTNYRIHAVRWPVFDGVYAQGLLLQPDQAPVARVIAIPDADWSPEMLVGLQPGVDASAQFARRLAENGCLVLVPTLIDRKESTVWLTRPAVTSSATKCRRCLPPSTGSPARTHGTPRLSP